MRWFKHLCEAHHDEDMELLMDLFGLEAYGFYWLLLEHLGSQLDEKNKTYLSLPEKIWRKNLRISAKKFKKIVGFLQEKQKISVEILRNSPELVKIDCPKLLGYRDEYTLRKKNISGQTPESVGTLSGQTPEQDTETDTETDKEKKKIKKEIQILKTPQAERERWEKWIAENLDSLKERFSSHPVDWNKTIEGWAGWVEDNWLDTRKRVNPKNSITRWMNNGFYTKLEDKPSETQWEY